MMCLALFQGLLVKQFWHISGRRVSIKNKGVIKRLKSVLKPLDVANAKIRNKVSEKWVQDLNVMGYGLERKKS